MVVGELVCGVELGQPGGSLVDLKLAFGASALFLILFQIKWSSFKFLLVKLNWRRKSVLSFE